MNSKKFLFYTAIAFILFLNLNFIIALSFNQESDIPEPRCGGSLVEMSNIDAQILNPVLSSDYTSKKIESFIFQEMITYDKDMNIIPELAKSWEISEDKLDYTFHLREDIYWHDGEPFNAEDVTFTINRMFDLARERWYFGDCFILGVAFDWEHLFYEEIDNYTVIFHLETPFTPMLHNLMFSIIPEHVYLNHAGVDGIINTADDCRDDNGTNTFIDDPANKYPIGTGSLMFSEWEIDHHITLIRNSVENGGPGNWREHDTYLDRYLLKIEDKDSIQPISYIPDSDLIDLNSFKQDEIESLKIGLDYNIYSSPMFASDHIAFQTDPSKGNLYNLTSRDFEENPNHFAGYEWQTAENPDIYGHLVRQALNYALDKEGLIDHVIHKVIEIWGLCMSHSTNGIMKT